MNERTVYSLSNLAGLDKILCQFKLTEMNNVDKIEKLTNLNPPMANGGVHPIQKCFLLNGESYYSKLILCL